MQELERPALRRVASIGTLYDAKSDRFLDQSILPDALLADNVSTRSEWRSKSEAHRCESYSDGLGTLSIDHETAVNILSGLVDLHGAAVFLRDYLQLNRRDCLAILSHRFSTVRQTLENYRLVFGSNSVLMPSEMEDCTHVVTGIAWGLQTVVAVDHSASARLGRTPRPEQLEAELNSLREAIRSIGISHPTSPSDESASGGAITLYSDVLHGEGLVMRDQAEALDFIRLVPEHIKQENCGKGWPLSYTMIPVHLLKFFLPQIRHLPPDGPRITGSDILSDFIEAFDALNGLRAGLLEYHDFLTHHRLHVADYHIQDVADTISSLERFRTSSLRDFRRVLVDVRSGKAELNHLPRRLRHIMTSSFSSSALSSIIGQEREKLEFVQEAMSHGAKYIGFNGVNMNRIMEIRQDQGYYLFHFDSQSMQNETDWPESCALLMSLLDQADSKFPVYLVDQDAIDIPGRSSRTPCLSLYKAGNRVIPDVLARNRLMESHCLARYRDSELDKSGRQRPSKRRYVKIPCPCVDCDSSSEQEWMCPECLAPIEYGFTDSFLYCDCGRCLYSSYKFKCNGERHQSGYSRYDPDKLHQLLRGLDQSNYVNILIMGETGVGKSTFINAFVNYLSFSTLDEAQEADGLTSVIPCSFFLQTMDRERPDIGIQEYHVSVGARDDEEDGSKGDSATQKTAVYPVTIGSKTYRLIDTPGIGDTRGTSFDKKNMADILETISSYDELHGILILLKSNNSRLTVTFRFCVQELLTHLHRSAAEAMAFGFTNTRISNYTPGDTFKPLKTLLTAYSDVGLSLSTSTTYCFDSESFRYLAARKQGVPVDNEEDFRRSWDHSRKEALRLVDYFASTSPHPVVSTLSLNGTRKLISSLITPMAQISELVVKNLAFYEDQRNTLADTKLSADALRRRLLIEKIQYVARKLDRPRTVCKRVECCDFKDSGKGDGEVVTIYKTHCHRECYLNNVTQDVVADPGLIQCAAFAGSSFCRSCSHSWQEHLHVIYELDEVVVKVKDQEIERQLRAKADDMTLRQTAIQRLDTYIEESKDELSEIRRATGRFWLFLKSNAITPVNNATLEYLDMLIKEEKSKVSIGRQRHMSVERNEKRLKALEAEKKDHLQLLETLDQNMREPKGPEDMMLDEKGVDEVVQRLYRLKHFGSNLRDVKYVITSAIEDTYRERPFRVATRPTSMRDGPGRDFRGRAETSPRYRWSRPGERQTRPNDEWTEEWQAEGPGPSSAYSTRSYEQETYASVARAGGSSEVVLSKKPRACHEGRQGDSNSSGRKFLRWMVSHMT